MDENLLKEIDSILPSKGLKNYFDSSIDDDIFCRLDKKLFQEVDGDWINGLNENITIDETSKHSTDGFWLMSESCKIILAKLVSKEISQSSVPNSNLAKPLISINSTQLIDPIFHIIKDNYDVSMASELRQIPKGTNNFNFKNFLSLINLGWIRPAIDMTTSYLKEKGFDNLKCSSIFDYNIGKIWSIRFSLMLKIKMFTIIEEEMSGFQNMDCPNLYSEFYNETTKGSLIPFSLRLIHAELPSYLNKISESLNRLHYLSYLVKHVLTNINSGLNEDGTYILNNKEKTRILFKKWNNRKNCIFTTILKVLISNKDYQTALDNLHFTLNENVGLNLASIQSLIAKLYLLVGNIDQTNLYFEKSLNTLKDYSSDEDLYNLKLIVTKAFMAIAQNNYEEAKLHFINGIKLEENNLDLVNNYAVCCLYSKSTNEAISLLEKYIQNGKFNDVIIFNLCIFYELQTTHLKHKKLKLVKIISRFPGDGFVLSTFKLPNSE